ncbi:unnamed protein product [Schistocephalus solidus]|uniref:SPOC domain-containing protein n=1 Tax=Schistocephalus solidus TaxID=70667 RepID=A0A183S796_SCHSO|nr:unnamed protein product [Schistocephalus solidus]
MIPRKLSSSSFSVLTRTKNYVFYPGYCYCAHAYDPFRSTSPPQAYPLVWQGRLSLKNAEACVALHFVQGNQALVTTGGPLRIVQRMRLESAQLEAVQRKMTQEGASCACVAFASGSSHADLIQQTRVLSEGFIRYMQEKGAAGIINVGHPNLTQVF